MVNGFMVFNATLNNTSAISIRGGQFYWWKKPEYPEKTTDLSLAIVKLYHILYNNTPSKAIVNAASNITYRPLIEADDTGRCTLII